MKFKKNIFTCVLIVLLMLTTNFAYGATITPNDTKLFDKYITRMNDLNILNFGTKDKNTIITRQVFSKAIVVAADLEYFSNVNTQSAGISDISNDNPYKNYMNTAINDRLMDLIVEDDKFYPAKQITFYEACMSMVRVLGYYIADRPETWPSYYMSMANKLGITTNLSFKADSPLPLWAAATMFERFLNTKPNSSDQKLYEKENLYTELLFLNNSGTDTKLQKNQIQTDKGIYTIGFSVKNSELGYKYRVKVDDGKIVKIYSRLNSIDTMIVDSNFTPNEFIGGIPYYINGTEKSYDDAKNISNMDSTVIYGYNDDKTNYEYAIIVDPIYSNPVIVKSKNGIVNTGNIKVSILSNIINENGQIVKPSDIEESDVLYQVSDIFGKSEYILAVQGNVEGTIAAISLSSTSSKYIKIASDKYEISPYADSSKLSTLQIDDKVSLILGYDGKVIDVNKIQYKTGPYVECIVTGIDSAAHNVITNVGTYDYLDELTFQIGDTNKIVIDDSTIIKSRKEDKISKTFTVDHFVDNTIFYKDGSNVSSITPPKTTTYYYGEKKVDYASLKDILQVDSIIVFVKNAANTGYSYGVILDPIYSKPAIFGIDRSIGSSNISSIYKFCKYLDVVYTVTDAFGNNAQTIITSNTVTGNVNSILPNKNFPSSIQCDGHTYAVSKYFDNSSIDYISIGSNVKVVLVLGYDGKVIYMKSV